MSDSTDGGMWKCNRCGARKPNMTAMWICYDCVSKEDALQAKLEIAKEALENIYSPTFMGKHPAELAKDALAEIAKLGEKK